MVSKVIPKDAMLIPDTAERVFNGIIYDVYHWQQELYDGSFTTFEMLRRLDTVETIGVVGDTVLLIEDEQPNRSMRLSVPSGRVEADERILDAAKREMLEETGHQFKNWRLLNVRQPQAKVESFVHLYVAWGGEQSSSQHLDAGEKITVDPASFERLKQLIADKVGYLGELEPVLEGCSSIEDVLALPEFTGEVVER